MTGFSFNKKAVFASFWGAGLAVLCGLTLWGTDWGDPWVHASYNILFRFGSPGVTNQVTLIQMDKEAFEQFHQNRDVPWDRGLHAQLLNRLADDGCAMVVFDSFFKKPGNLVKDKKLADAIRRLRHIVLLASQTEVDSSRSDAVQPVPPIEPFLSAAGTNWGVGWFDPDLDMAVRRQWPFPSPGPYPSLSWKAAELAGAHLDTKPRNRWLRYYGEYGRWDSMSYGFALTKPANYFHNRIVFIGTQPEKTVPVGKGDNDLDKFNTPYTSWTGEASGGVELIVTCFLNLLNNQSLLRPPAGIEILTLILSGMLLGGGLCHLPLRIAIMVAGGIFAVVSLAAIELTFHSNYWFPWLVILGGQLPCGLIYASVPYFRRSPVTAAAPAAASAPKTPGYKLVYPPFAEGAYGRVWLARNRAGKWLALKVIYQSNFGEDTAPYEREFSGVQKYKSISTQHPGLLRVDFVSEKKNGCFYYAMELGDALVPGWEKSPGDYKPRDLVSIRAELRGRRLPARNCVEIGIKLCDALDFLHRQGITHRDIKPQNIIFVNGEPKLADLGLIREIRPAEEERTLVGTPGYMPPLPERPGTIAADIYALGMVLYVVCTGRQPGLFPEVATTLVSTEAPPDFWPLNSVVLRACQPVREDRFPSAAEMRVALEKALQTIKSFDTASQ